MFEEIVHVVKHMIFCYNSRLGERGRHDLSLTLCGGDRSGLDAGGRTRQYTVSGTGRDGRTGHLGGRNSEETDGGAGWHSGGGRRLSASCGGSGLDRDTSGGSRRDGRNGPELGG